jgi:hypothetical protein
MKPSSLFSRRRVDATISLWLVELRRRCGEIVQTVPGACLPWSMQQPLQRDPFRQAEPGGRQTFESRYVPNRSSNDVWVII